MSTPREPDPSRARHGFSIRPERPEDETDVASVVEAAFESSVQSRLVAAIRASASFMPDLSLVAEIAERIVGHVMISVAHLANDGIRQPIANLSPLAVSPDHQGRGIGSALVNEVSTRAERRGEPLVVLEGDPRYYSRLGFEAAAPLGIHLPLPAWAPQAAAQVRRLRTYEPTMRGQVVYPAAFDEVEH